jgi:hypothetical protein
MKGNELPITKELVRKNLEEDGAIDGDGHSLVSADWFIKRGFDPEDIEKLVHRHQSGSGKYQIYDGNGNPVEYMDAVYCLDFHYWVARTVGVEFMEAFGRGTQARHIRTALKKWVDDSEA